MHNAGRTSFPLYASWSSDNGKTWTPRFIPAWTVGAIHVSSLSLMEGSIKLGRRYSEGWSIISPVGDQEDLSIPEKAIQICLSAVMED